MNGASRELWVGLVWTAVLLGCSAAWAQGGGQPAVPEWEREMDVKLSEAISVQFDGTELPKALGYFRERTKLNIILDMGSEAQTGAVPRVTLKLDGVQAESALAWTVRLAGLTYVVRDQAVYVTRESKVDPEWRQEMRARYVRRMSDLKTGWMRQIESRMNKKIDVQFRNEPVDRAAEMVAVRGGLNIVVDTESAQKARTVNWEAKQMTVENVLRWMTQFSGLRYAIRDEVVYIGSQADLARLQLETGQAGVPAKFLQAVTFDFRDEEVSQAIGELQRKSGVTIELSQQPKPERKVSVKGTGVELDKAVRMVLDKTGLGYAISYRGDTMVVIMRDTGEMPRP